MASTASRMRLSTDAHLYSGWTILPGVFGESICDRRNIQCMPQGEFECACHKQQSRGHAQRAAACVRTRPFRTLVSTPYSLTTYTFRAGRSNSNSRAIDGEFHQEGEVEQMMPEV